MRAAPDLTAGRLRAVTALALVSVTLVALAFGAPSGAAAQEDPDPVPATEAPLTEAPASTAAPVASSTTVPLIGPTGGAGDAAPSASDQASRRIQLVVGALIALALVVAVATVIFFRRTNPSKITAAEAAQLGGRVRNIARPSPEDDAEDVLAG